MDDIIFYQPPSTSSSQPPRLPGALTASILSRGSIAPISVRQTAQLIPQNEMWKDHMIKDRDLSDPSQKRHPPAQRCRNDAVQEQGSLKATRYSPNGDDDTDFPAIAEILSGIKPNDVSPSANLNSDDDDSFLDIDELLAGVQQKSVSASAKLGLGSTAEKVDDGTRGGSPVDSCRSTEGSSPDPDILSDDESVGAESETDYSNPDVDLTAKSDSHSPHITDSDLADSNGFGSKTTLISDCLAAHRDDANDNGVVDGAKPQLAADRPRPASPSHWSVTRQATPLQVNTEIIQENASINLDAKGDNDNDTNTRSTKRSRSSAISYNNSASDSNVSAELQDSQHDPAQSPQPRPVAASLHQSDLTNDPLSRYPRRRNATRDVRRKRPRTTAPARLASTVSAALGSTDLREP